MRLGIGFLAFVFFACASQVYRIANQDISLADMRRAVVSVVGDPRELSQNQRVYFSQYFSRKPDPKFDPEKSKERLYAKVSVLGDRRPYNIEVEVLIEKRDFGEYVLAGLDYPLAQKIGKDIRSKLNQSRENRNAIDDFRAF